MPTDFLERGRSLPVGLLLGQSGHRRSRPVPGPEPESQPQKEDSGKPGPADGGRQFHSFSFPSDYHSPPANATVELVERPIGEAPAIQSEKDGNPPDLARKAGN